MINKYVTVQFAGSDGFCGGFNSPLMVFLRSASLDEAYEYLKQP
jgi:hypothetical protein